MEVDVAVMVRKLVMEKKKKKACGGEFLWCLLWWCCAASSCLALDVGGGCGTCRSIA